MILHIDFETRSAVDLTKAGVYRYAEDPSTDILCMAYAFDDDEPELWVPGDPVPEVVAGHVEDNGALKAHNASFERIIWRDVLGPRYGFPIPDMEQWYCSAAEAAAMGLPRHLGQLASVLKLDQQKDDGGHRLMLLLSKPRKPRKDEDPAGLYWYDDPERLKRLYAYCRQDVRVEQAVSKYLRPLSAAEREVYLADQRLNDRGIMVDLPLVEAAEQLAEAAKKAANAELEQLTGIEAVTAVGQLTEYTGLPDFRRDTLEKALKSGELDDTTQRVVELRLDTAKTSVQKLPAMRTAACSDGRVRGTLLYHGAGTGRWCLTGDHEVLTPEGWVRLDRWEGGRIAVWSTNESVSFQDSERVSFPYEGELCSIEGARVSQLSTPDHKMYAYNGRTGEAKDILVGEWPGRRQLPYTGTLARANGENPDHLRVLIMTQADGHYTQEGSVRYHFSKRRKAARCRRLLRRAGISFSFNMYGGRYVFEVRRRHVPLWLRMFENKTFGWWLIGSDPAVVFDELERWDAYRCGPNSIQYSTTNKENADIIQALAHTSGLSANILTKERDNPDWNTVYCVNIWLAPSNRYEHRRGVDRVAGFSGMVYCAVTPTGYFLVRRNGKVWVTGNSGRLVQFQNVPRGEVQDPERLIPLVLAGDLDAVSEIAPPMVAISSLLRSMVRAAPGHKLIAGDYAQIEARVLAWLAGQEDVLELFANDGPVYETMGAAIHGVSLEAVTKDMRQDGKTAVLGCGYGLGAKKFASVNDVSLEFAERVVGTYRERNRKIVQLWYNLERDIYRAAANPGSVVSDATGGRVKYTVRGQYLWCQLPSKRFIAYPLPIIEQRETPWGDVKPCVTVCNVNSMTRKWERRQLYGGLATENVVQAIARDLLADAWLRAERAGYPPVMSVHDELVVEVPEDFGSADEFAAIMAETPAWADGLPVKVEAWEGLRYKK